MDLLEISGFGPALVLSVAKHFPLLLDTPALRRNPYLLTTVKGVGFLRADTAAMALGVSPESPLRVRAASSHVLMEAEKDGHTALPWSLFEKKLAKTLKLAVPSGDVEIDDTKVAIEADLLSRRSTLAAERAVASAIRRMLDAGPPPHDLEYSDHDLAADQKHALSAMHKSRVFILAGSPGTGKTRTIKAIVDGTDVRALALCAPTGKAAKRIEELTGITAKTIHRTLGVVGEPTVTEEQRARCTGECDPEINCPLCVYDGIPRAHSPGFKFKHNRHNPLPFQTVIVDETSMVDIRLMADLCEALHPAARLILVGDTFQLPSVGPGSVLRDLIDGGVPHFELTTLKRQDPDLLIARNCRLVRHEKRIAVANAAASDFYFQPCEEPARIAELVVDYHVSRIPRRTGVDATKDIVTLTALREQGDLSTLSLNYALRRQLNRKIGDALLDSLAPGDRVIQTRNDYDLEIMNGDLGVIEDMDREYLAVRFDTPPRTVPIRRKKHNLMLAWALTVHKAQGSEWPWVVIPVHEEQGRMVPNAQWLYTAISRARDVCIVIGQRAVLDRMAADPHAAHHATGEPAEEVIPWYQKLERSFRN